MRSIRKIVVNKLIISALSVLFFSFIYISLSTIYINEENYRTKAWNYVRHDNEIVNWKTAKVEKIKLEPQKSIIIPEKYFGKLNRALLNLNGNYSIRVTFDTEYDALLGPLTIYINPFTKQIIGIEYRE